EEARALDGAGQFALLLGRHGRDAGRHDLAALRDVARQQPGVLVVDLGRVAAGERAALAAPEERLASFHDYSPCGASDERCGRPESKRPRSPSPRGRRGPPKPPPPPSRPRPPKPPPSRPPRPPKPPPKPRPSRPPSPSGRPLFCNTADGPSSWASTAT